MARAPEPTPDLVQRALEGDRKAARALAGVLTPVIQARTTRVLLCRLARTRDLRQEVLDLTQQVFVHLFESDGRALRQWDPERGLSLENYVGLIAEQHAAALFRSQRKNPWRADAVDPSTLDEASTLPDPEQLFASKELADRILDAATGVLNDFGRYIFDLVFVQGLSVEEVCSRTELSPEAVYAWRSRLGRLVERLAREIALDAAAVDGAGANR